MGGSGVGSGVYAEPSLEDGETGLDEGGETFFLGLLGAEDSEKEVPVAFARAAEGVEDGGEGGRRLRLVN